MIIRSCLIICIISKLHSVRSFSPSTTILLPFHKQFNNHQYVRNDNNNKVIHNNGIMIGSKSRLQVSSTEATTASNDTISSNKVKDDNKIKERSKLRQLKDRMWVRETLEDLTAAEFATSLESLNSNNNSSNNNNNGKVDFEALVRKLNKRIEEMCTSSDMNVCSDMMSHEKMIEDDDMIQIGNDSCYILQKNSGMGSVVYTHEQREALLTRIIATRNNIYKLTQIDLYVEDKQEKQPEQAETNMDVKDVANLDDIRTQLQDSTIVTPSMDNNDNDTNKSDLKVKLYVREDGTVDWDGALQDRAALKQFGSAVWARINGMDPQNLSDDDNLSDNIAAHAQESDKVTAKIIETEAIKQMKAKLDSLTQQLKNMEKDHKALLISAVSEGSAVANINLATIDPSLRAKIRSSDDALQTKQLEVTIQSLNYELERIFTYLEGEMGNTFAKGYISLSDRLAVAEFGLLESQIDTINKQLLSYQNTDRTATEQIDEDVLAVVKDQMIDFKRRLGIDYYVTGLSLDSEAVQRFVKDTLVKGKEGVAFYVKGCQLLWNDSVFCAYLFGRAVQGYTLKPREVRTLRRTIRDIVTFIPVVIILIIPLSPIGHVLVFGAIQRFFPDFFPSCFTERRQNLLQLYESTEYSEITVQETAQQKLLRAVDALKVITVNGFEKAMESLNSNYDYDSASDVDATKGINGVKDDKNNTNGASS